MDEDAWALKLERQLERFERIDKLWRLFNHAWWLAIVLVVVWFWGAAYGMDYGYDKAYYKFSHGLVDLPEEDE